MSIGEKIKAIRKALRLTQAELGARLEIGANSIGMIETGRNNPTLTQLAVLFEKLNVSPNWFFLDQGDMFSTYQNANYSDDILMKIKVACNCVSGSMNLITYLSNNGKIPVDFGLSIHHNLQSARGLLISLLPQSSLNDDSNQQA